MASLREWIDLVEGRPGDDEGALWNGKHVVDTVGNFRIVVDDPTDATYVTAWTPDNKRVGSLSTRSLPGKIGRQYLGIGTVEVAPKYRGSRLGTAMYRALLQCLAPKWDGVASYLPDRANKRHVPKIHRRLGGFHPEGDLDYIVIPRPDRS